MNYGKLSLLCDADPVYTSSYREYDLGECVICLTIGLPEADSSCGANTDKTL